MYVCMYVWVCVEGGCVRVEDLARTYAMAGATLVRGGAGLCRCVCYVRMCCVSIVDVLCVYVCVLCMLCVLMYVCMYGCVYV